MNQKKHYGLLAGVVLLAAIVLSACLMPPAETGNTNDNANTNTNTNDNLAGMVGPECPPNENAAAAGQGNPNANANDNTTLGGAPGLTPFVLANDQDASDGEVIVDCVVAAEDGWIDIHADDGGQPGGIIGFAAVHTGPNKDVVVTLTEPATPILWAMLHIDAGVKGEMEWPDGADVPVKEADGMPLMDDFADTSMGGVTGGTTGTTTGGTTGGTTTGGTTTGGTSGGTGYTDGG